MGLFSVKGFLISSVLVVVLAIGLQKYAEYSNASKQKQIEEWAEANKINVKSSKIDLKPFQIEFDETEWKKLLDKLENTRYFSLLDEKIVPRMEYGFDPEYAKELVDYWKTKFDWRKHVERLNRFKQFKININDTNIHFVREIVDNKQAKTLKIILLDGWPGHFFGFYEMIDYIRTNANKEFNYDIVLPSIPGFGYSMPLNKPLDTFDTAQLLDGVMRYLHGDDVQYYLHGEDWGSAITTTMAKLYPSRVKGLHLTMPTSITKSFDLEYWWLMALRYIAPSFVFTPVELENNMPERTSIQSKVKLLLKESGYFHIQATKPDSLGHGLTDSPVGLLAYILEKYALGSFGFDIYGKKDGGLDNYSKDDLLSVITYYWMTNTITSSMRFYKNFVRQFGTGFPKETLIEIKMHSRVPIGIHLFKNELIFDSKAFLQLQFPNLKRYTLESHGGHFAGFENPKKSADDFFAFIWSTFEQK